MDNKELGLSEEALNILSTWLSAADPSRTILQLLHAYDVQPTVARLLKFASHIPDFRVALQFPDDLLHHAPLICEALRILTEQTLDQQVHRDDQQHDKTVLYFILGDTSYGECCVDEVAAEHLTANLVVHYGPACLSPTRTLPVLYVFPKLRFTRPQQVRLAFEQTVTTMITNDEIDRVVIMYDVELFHCFKDQSLKLNDEAFPLHFTPTVKRLHFASLRLDDIAHIIPPASEAASTSETKVRVGPLAFDRSDTPISRTAFLWFTHRPFVDDWPAATRNAALQLCTGTQPHCAAFYVASLTPTAEEDVQPSIIDASRVLRKRFSVIAKIKDAQRIGIVPGTLGVSGNLDVIDRCKRVIKSADKRSYVMLVGKPNPAKLANFAEIDVFVLVACPQNALLDGRDYLQPIVTPLELEAALLSDGDIFSSPYSVDFRDLLETKLKLEESNNEGADGDADESAVAVRGDWSISVAGEGSASEFLKSRHWQGLGYSTGGNDNETDVAHLSVKATLGQTGIASKYDTEVKHAKPEQQPS